MRMGGIRGFCDYGTEPTGYITDRVLLDQRGVYILPRKDPAPWN